MYVRNKYKISNKTFRVLFLVFVGVGLSACSNINTSDTNKFVPVNIIENNYVHYSYIKAKIIDDRLIIEGRLKRRPSSMSLFGHVDIRILDKQGMILDRKPVGFRYIHSASGTGKEYDFYTLIKAPPENIASVQLRYHKDPNTPH